MRTVALCLLIALAGCAQPVEEKSVAVEVAIAASIEDQEPDPPVPQDADNLAQLERTRKSNDPLHRDLANGRFRGGKLADLVAVYPPDLILEHGRYTTAVYADGKPRESLSHVYVVARKGKLVRAFGSSCVWHPVFFDGLTGEERKDWGEGYWDAFNKHFGIRPAPPPAPADDNIPPPREAGKQNP